jgi:alkanesulfonate monooxygenase SsuD/methylene tetrahydromethanopterin reductase-like flavin-dependent oxidoreductase (luciferase family)
VRIGIGLPNQVRGAEPAIIPSWAAAAERAGFGTLATVGRIAYPGVMDTVALAAAAAITDSAELLAAVALGPVWPPVLLAKEAAGIDAVSGGRLTLGLGVGLRPDDFVVGGLGMAARGKRLDEDLDVYRRVWKGEPVGGGPSPGVTPGAREIPLMFGGGVAAAYERVARRGTGYIGPSVPAAMVAPLFEGARAAWDEAGRAGSPRLVAIAYFALGYQEQGRGNVWDAGRRRSGHGRTAPSRPRPASWSSRTATGCCRWTLARVTTASCCAGTPAGARGQLPSSQAARTPSRRWWPGPGETTSWSWSCPWTAAGLPRPRHGRHPPGPPTPASTFRAASGCRWSSAPRPASMTSSPRASARPPQPCQGDPASGSGYGTPTPLRARTCAPGSAAIPPSSAARSSRHCRPGAGTPSVCTCARASASSRTTRKSSVTAGAGAITSAEAVFAADSQLALAVLRAAPDLGQRTVAAALSAATTVIALTAGGSAEAIGRPRLDRAARTRYGLLRPQARAAWPPPATGVPVTAVTGSAWTAWRESLTAYRDALDESRRASCASSLIHMSANRLLGTLADERIARALAADVLVRTTPLEALS